MCQLRPLFVTFDARHRLDGVDPSGAVLTLRPCQRRQRSFPPAQPSRPTLSRNACYRTPRIPRPATPPKQRKLEIPTYDFSAALRLERELGVSHVVAQILVRRGLGEPDDARAYLDPRERHDPAAFAGIERAVDVIERHTRAGTRITVHGDYDVDGVCATAVVVRALRALGATVDWFVPGRLDDGYGLSSETVHRLAARGTGLLLTVDCGITAVEEVAEATSLGIDVVLTDHHAPRADGRLPAARSFTPASAVIRAPTCAVPPSRSSSRRRSELGPRTMTSSSSRSRPSPT